MAPLPQSRRLWIQFLREALGGSAPRDLEPERLLDLTAAFARCRAAALFAPAGEGRLGVHGASAALRGQQAALEQVLGPARDAAALAALARTAPASAWPLTEILEQDLLVPLRGLALGLECLAVSLHTPEGGDLSEGFLLALWEEETPAASSLDRAQLAALALGSGVGSEARAGAASEAARAKAGVLRELEALAREHPDPLSALPPHSRLLEDLDSAVAEAGRRGEPLALILIDADDLAAVNRAHGPQAGDLLLHEIASILVEEAGSGDLVVRYGMEEFALLVHNADPRRVRSRAQEIQKRIRERRLPGPSGSRPGSVSVGAACLPDSLATDATALRLKAEQALELARQHRPGGLIIL